MVVPRARPAFGPRANLRLQVKSCDPFAFVSCRFALSTQFRRRHFVPFSPFFNDFGSPFFASSPLFWSDYGAATSATPQYVVVPGEAAAPPQSAPRVEEEQSPPAPPKPAAEKPQPVPEVRATVLVFRNQHREEIRNYAIVGSTLYEFLPHGRRKIALSELDLPATQQANEERGVEFYVPAQHGS